MANFFSAVPVSCLNEFGFGEMYGVTSDNRSEKNSLDILKLKCDSLSLKIPFQTFNHHALVQPDFFHCRLFFLKNLFLIALYRQRAHEFILGLM